MPSFERLPENGIIRREKKVMSSQNVEECTLINQFYHVFQLSLCVKDAFYWNFLELNLKVIKKLFIHLIVVKFISFLEMQF